MKWLRSIFSRRSTGNKPDSRIYTVGGKTAPRVMIPRVRSNVPKPDPIFDDTGSLALRDEQVDDQVNPYDTASWQLDPDKRLRRVDDDKTVRKDRGKNEPNNPYNTGAFRKGW